MLRFVRGKARRKSAFVFPRRFHTLVREIQNSLNQPTERARARFRASIFALNCLFSVIPRFTDWVSLQKANSASVQLKKGPNSVRNTLMLLKRVLSFLYL